MESSRFRYACSLCQHRQPLSHGDCELRFGKRGGEGIVADAPAEARPEELLLREVDVVLIREHEARHLLQRHRLGGQRRQAVRRGELHSEVLVQLVEHGVAGGSAQGGVSGERAAEGGAGGGGAPTRHAPLGIAPGDLATKSAAMIIRKAPDAPRRENMRRGRTSQL